MLTKEERRLVVLYYMMASLSRVFIIICPLMLIEFGILVYINDAFIHAGGINYTGLATIIAIFLIDIVGLSVCFLVPRFGMDKPAWTKIRQKAGKKGKRGTYREEGEPSVSYALDRGEEYAFESASMARETEFVAKTLKVKVPSRIVLAILACLLCTAAMLAAHLPYYFSQHEANEQSRAAAVETYDEVVRGISSSCASVSGSSPQDRYRPEGYDVFGYLYGSDVNEEVYVSVGISADGIVDSIVFSLGIDESENRETALARAKNEYLGMYKGIATIDAPFAYEGMLSLDALPNEFCEQFLTAPPNERVEATVHSRFAQPDADDSHANISVTYFDSGYGDSPDWQIRVTID